MRRVSGADAGPFFHGLVGHGVADDRVGRSQMHSSRGYSVARRRALVAERIPAWARPSSWSSQTAVTRAITISVPLTCWSRRSLCLPSSWSERSGLSVSWVLIDVTV